MISDVPSKDTEGPSTETNRPISYSLSYQNEDGNTVYRSVATDQSNSPPVANQAVNSSPAAATATPMEAAVPMNQERRISEEEIVKTIMLDLEETNRRYDNSSFLTNCLSPVLQARNCSPNIMIGAKDYARLMIEINKMEVLSGYTGEILRALSVIRDNVSLTTSRGNCLIHSGLTAVMDSVMTMHEHMVSVVDKVDRMVPFNNPPKRGRLCNYPNYDHVRMFQTLFAKK